MLKKTKKTSPRYFDYKDVENLRKYIDGYGQIETRAKSGLSAKSQRQMATAVKRARHIGLLPFVAS